MKVAALPSGGGRVTRLSREAEVEEATPRAENLPPIRIPRLMPSRVIGNVDLAAFEQTIGQSSLYKTGFKRDVCEAERNKWCHRCRPISHVF